MTLVNITLTESEQDLLTAFADEMANLHGILTPWEGIAEKIRKAQDSSAFEIYPPSLPGSDYYGEPCECNGGPGFCGCPNCGHRDCRLRKR
jgi:hypothetical protein